MKPPDDLFGEWSALWIPPKRLPLSKWAEKNFVLSAEYSAVSGELRLHGYQREPFDAFTDPRVSEIVLKVGTQVLKTLLIQAAMAYVAAEDPGPVLISQPKEADAETFSKERLMPMVRDIPALHGKIESSSSRKSSNTTLYKEFPGGSWSIVGAGAPGNAARRSIRYYFGDEVNKYPPSSGNEGSFTDLADERTATFRSRAKRIYACSPTVPEGVISRKYEASDQRRPWAACYACGERQVLGWQQVTWDHDVPEEDQPETARYKCAHCPALWNDIQRWRAADGSVWIAQKPFRGIAGFWLSHLYSPYKTLGSMVKKWLSVNKAKDQEGRRVFINTNLAEEWVEKGEAPIWRAIYDRAIIENLPRGIVPMGGLVITAGADVQKDRIEVSFYAWGRRRESWLIRHEVIAGDPEKPETWAKVDELLNTTFTHAGGRTMSALRFCIDSGYATNAVYAWARRQGAGRVMVVKGVGYGSAPLGQPSATDVSVNGKRLKRGVQVWPVSGSILKPQFYGWLGLEAPIKPSDPFPDGYCHFPQMNEEFFEQLVAEELVTKADRNGYRKSEWIKTRERNEALDCRIYATAGAISVGIERFSERNWKPLEEMLIPEGQRPAVSPVVRTPKPGWVPKRENWLQR